MGKLILFGHEGRTDVRVERGAADAPAAGAWTPDNLNANEISASVEADDVILAAAEWEDVRLVAYFNGSPGGAETVTVQPLRAVRVPVAPGREWISAGDPIDLAPHGASSLVLTDGADYAFRITAVTLDSADDVTLFVTGGQRTREIGV